MSDNIDIVNHPSHYTSSGMECIDEMIILYGKEETMSFCKLNCHKYRKRAMDKGGRTDLKKSDWYVKKYLELISKPELELIKEIKLKYPKKKKKKKKKKNQHSN